MKKPSLLVLSTATFCFFFPILGYFLRMAAEPVETTCSDGHSCPPKFECCDEGCCALATIPPSELPSDQLKDIFKHQWYIQWQALFVIGTVMGLVAWCAWCIVHRRPGMCMCSLTCCAPRGRSDGDSAGSVYPPPRYSRCGSIHQAPPPYSEVTSKPDLYPLVITCGEGNGKPGGNYLMVQYFRNYVIRAPGSISATSTAESLNSSFICNAVNEANTIVPPPYSASNCSCGAGCGRALRSLTSLSEARRRDIITPDQNYDLELDLIDCELYCDGGCKPRLGSSPPPRRSSPNTDETYCERAAYLRQFFLTSPDTPAGCESPPQPTSPTQSRDSTLRRQIDERCQRRHDLFRKQPRTRKSSLYIPLSKIPPGTRKLLTRSAPATPSGALVPNILNFTQRVSSRHSSRSSRLEEENDPLLAEVEPSSADHKF